MLFVFGMARTFPLVTRPALPSSLGDARHVHGSRPLDPADEESAVFSLPGLRILTRGPCTTVAALRCSAGGVGLATDPSMDTCKGDFRMVPRIRKPGDVKEHVNRVAELVLEANPFPCHKTDMLKPLASK